MKKVIKIVADRGDLKVDLVATVEVPGKPVSLSTIFDPDGRTIREIEDEFVSVLAKHFHYRAITIKK